jgi:demethylmenaquinone methyltransferase/2-methoxy-6-polyprenyl-1,4-benzoquinol methylase
MRMFDRIAKTYDGLYGVLSFGIDRRWRQRLADMMPQKAGLKVLDVATGTADSLIEIALARPQLSQAIGIDMSQNMLAIARNKISCEPSLEKLQFLCADACNLPFENNSFDVVGVAFGVRNIVKLEVALLEMHRVLNGDGSIWVLEFSKPKNALIRRLFFLYLRYILPHIGRLLSGDKEGYRYLNKTIEAFLNPNPYHKMKIRKPQRNILCFILFCFLSWNLI